MKSNKKAMKSTSKKKANAKRSSRKTRSAPVMMEETTEVVSQPATELRHEPVTLSRVLGERVVAKPVIETEITRRVRTRKKGKAA